MTVKQKFSMAVMLASMVLLLTFGAYSFYTTVIGSNTNQQANLQVGTMSLKFSDGKNEISEDKSK